MRSRRHNFNAWSATVLKPATLKWSPAVGLYVLTFPINFKNKAHQDYKDVLKSSIPASERVYNARTHEWFIDEKWFQFVLTLTQATFGTIEVVSRAEWVKKQEEEDAKREWFKNWTTANTGTNISSHYDLTKDYQTFIQLVRSTTGIEPVKDMGLDVATKHYRITARKLHPDITGGSTTEQMTTLNEVFTRLKNGGFFK